jgi:chromosome segregation ATPase
MAENQPPANASHQPPDNIVLRAPLGASNGREPFKKPSSDHRMLDYESERKGRVSAEKNLAEATTKIGNLCQLQEQRNLLLAKLKTDNKCLSDSLKSQKSLAKKELDAEKASTQTQIQNKKDAVKVVQTSKQALKKDFDKQKKIYDSLVRVSNGYKVKISDLNCTQTSLMRTRTELQNEVKLLTKEVRTLTKKVDAQLMKKLDHELSMQKMKNEYKQLDLDQAREKLENKKAPINKTLAAALTLEDKKELESHKVDCKRRSKDDDFARDKMKKDTKARDVQSNLGFAANMLQNTSNMNGGMWQTGSVADVSC